MIHLLVVLLVVATGDVVHPVLVVEDENAEIAEFHKMIQSLYNDEDAVLPYLSNYLLLL